MAAGRRFGLASLPAWTLRTKLWLGHGLGAVPQQGPCRGRVWGCLTFPTRTQLHTSRGHVKELTNAKFCAKPLTMQKTRIGERGLGDGSVQLLPCCRRGG